MGCLSCWRLIAARCLDREDIRITKAALELAFAGVIAVRTEWTTMAEKELMCMQTAKIAQMRGAQGATVAWDAGGNQFMEVIRTVRACERVGIKAVLLTTEDEATGGAPTLLEPLFSAWGRVVLE